MRKFSTKGFIGSVSNLKGQTPYVTSNSQSKYLIIRAAKDKGYTPEDVYTCLSSLIEEHHPDYMSKYNTCQWVKVYGHYIRKGGELSKRLREVLDMFGDNKLSKKNNDELREWFFDTIRDMGINPKIMEIDMSIDMFGWFNVLQLILTLSKKSSSSTSVKKIEPVSVGHVIGKSRTRIRYREIQQLSMDGKLIRTWKNISEICKANPNYKHSSISKCVGGSYKSAHNHIWKGVREDRLRMAA